MGDDFTYKKEWSGKGRTWYKRADPRPPDVRAATGSQTVQDSWIYDPDPRLELRFETNPVRGFGIFFDEQRIGFSEGDEIAAARELAEKLHRQRRGNAAN